MFDVDEAHRLFRLSHAAVGFAGLGMFWIPVLARKGSRLHIRGGRFFVWCAYYVTLTGLAASVWGLVHPVSFIEEKVLRPLDDDQVRLAAERLRFILSITGFLALGVLSGVLLGVSVMRARERHERLRRPIVLAPIAAFLLWSAGLAVYGAGSLAAAYAGWHFIPASAAHPYWLGAALGVIGVYGAIGDLRYVYGPPPNRIEWWSMHMQCMIGAGAGFYAAFFLFGAGQLAPFVRGWQLLAPLIPLVIGGIATRLWLRYYERKFGGDASGQMTQHAV
jgi:heme exporter protein D